MFNSFAVFLEQLNTQLEEISNFIDKICISEISRSTVSYNAVIISLYGCYENFVDSLVSELICQISDKSTDYTEIPTDMRVKNINLSSDFLNAKQRYTNFNLQDEDVINNIYSGKITNKLLLKHGGNLSIAVLSDYMKSLGIKNIAQSIKNSDEYHQYYSEKNRIPVEDVKSYLDRLDNNTAFNLLDDIISQRNTIAHSWKSDDKVDYSIIKDEWIKFIQVFCKCLYIIIIQFYSEWLVKHNKLFCPLKFQIYGSSIVGFFDVISYWNGNYETILIKSNDKIHICKLKNVKIFKNHQTSMEIEGHSLNKEKPERYSFYFNNAFLKEYTSANEESEDFSFSPSIEMTAPKGTAVEPQT